MFYMPYMVKQALPEALREIASSAFASLKPPRNDVDESFLGVLAPWRDTRSRQG